MFHDCECVAVREDNAEKCALHGTTRGPRPVWVDLSALWSAHASGPRVLGDGLDLRGDVPGLLHEWQRSATGDWIGVVTYSIDYADGRVKRHMAQRQLVPATVLRPRD